LSPLGRDVHEIVLKRPGLEGLQEPLAAPGYTLRHFLAGDEAAWAAVYAAAFPEQPDPLHIHENVFLKSPLWRPDRVWFACREDVPVACTAAWEDVGLWGPGTGQVHWVATHREHLRRGLARATVLAALRWMRQNGSRDAVLVTQDYRAAAIRLYLQLGFVPHLGAFPDMAARWAKVAAQLRA
jgi:mycothiol synthase